MTQPKHISVLQKETIEILDLKNGDIAIDATLGLGGHSELILQKITPDGFLYAFEWDKKNAEFAKKRLKAYEKSCKIIEKNFTNIDDVDQKVDKMLFDIGISSVHIDFDTRGFSFKKVNQLDMRMSDQTKLTAYDVVNTYREEDLARIIYQYGEEKQSRKIAREIVHHRKTETIKTTEDLVKIIEKVKSKGRWGGGHPAAQTFQALRIEVNDELGNIRTALEKAFDLLSTEGIIAVISFHSLEDRIVKNTFREKAKKCICPQDQIICTCQDRDKYELLTRKPIIPTEEEIQENPRSRSSKLRAIKKIS